MRSFTLALLRISPLVKHTYMGTMVVKVKMFTRVTCLSRNACVLFPEMGCDRQRLFCKVCAFWLVSVQSTGP